MVLPESEDERILKAAHRLNAMGAVGLILLGDKEAINSKNLNLNLENVEIIDPNTSHYREEFANHLYELRKSKGLSEQEAEQLALDKTYFATMLVHFRIRACDGFWGESQLTPLDPLYKSLRLSPA